MKNFSLPFREAYEKTAAIVNFAEKKNKRLEDLTIGELSSFLFYTVMLGGSMAGITGTLTQMLSSAAIAEVLFEYMDQEKKIKDV